MEHRSIEATEGGSLVVADPLRWASASVAPEQSARTLGNRPHVSMAVSSALVLTSPLAFIAASTLRLAALAETVTAACGRQPAPEPTPLRDEDLPTYSVLVPLYREADVVPDLARAMLALDYPADRLEVLILLEEADAETIEAARVYMAGAPFRVVVVPDGSPRTKPRACTYGLALCRGERVVVYDGEDRPEPDQLRLAAAALNTDPGRAVVQCRLACDHAAGASPLVRLWALDYDVLFGALLPTLSRAGLPFLLGGTSNHFRRDALLSVGGWDAHNVTEDADLAVRLARAGWRSGSLNSKTWEEAPLTLGAWVRQRSRWLKGFAVTTLVHGRRPVALLRDLGLRRTLALYAQLPAALLSVAAFPLGAGLVATGSADAASPLTWLLVAGNLASWLLAFRVACSRRRSPGVSLWLVGLLPTYWLALTWALVVGLAEVPRRRTCWSKTDHGLATRPTGA